MSAEHTHLDRQRRDRGECPACDEAWAQQDAVLKTTDPRIKAEQQITKLVEREGKLGEQRYGRRGHT